MTSQERRFVRAAHAILAEIDGKYEWEELRHALQSDPEMMDEESISTVHILELHDAWGEVLAQPRPDCDCAPHIHGLEITHEEYMNATWQNHNRDMPRGTVLQVRAFVAQEQMRLNVLQTTLKGRTS